MIKKRIVAMITTLIFVFATLCTPISFAGVVPYDDMSTNPSATSVNATDPDATDPDATDPNATDPDATDANASDPDATDANATDPDATDPNATDPDATAPNVIAEVSYWLNGNNIIEKICYEGRTYAEAYIPFLYDRSKDVKVKIIHPNETETTPVIKWEENQYGEAVFYSIIEEEILKHRLSVWVDDPSPDANCDILIKAYASESDYREFNVDSSVAGTSSGVNVTIPYGYNSKVELYVQPYEDNATIEELYDQGEEELGYAIVTDKKSTAFDIVAQNGDKKTYTLNFENSKGNSADIEMVAGFHDLMHEDTDYGSFREAVVSFDTGADGVSTADVILPIEYDDESGISLRIKNVDSYITEIENDAIHLGKESKKTVTFDVTSPDGSKTKTYQINFAKESEEASEAAVLDTLTVVYGDEDGEGVKQNIDLEDASDEDGATITIPDGMISDEMYEYYVDVYAKTAGYAFINESDTNAESYNSDCGLDYVKYSLDIASQNSATLIIGVSSSNGLEETLYKIQFINGSKLGNAQIDEVYLEYTRINEDDFNESLAFEAYNCVWLDQEKHTGEITLYPFDESMPVVLTGTAADGSQICENVTFGEGESEATVSFTSKSRDGENEIKYTITVSKPKNPIVNVHYVDGNDGNDSYVECSFSSDNEDTVVLPYNFKHLQMKVILLDGDWLDEAPEIIWESETRQNPQDEMHGTAQFTDNGNVYTINFISVGASSNKGVSMQIWTGKNGNYKTQDGKYISVSSEDAATETGAIVNIPYGCEDNTYFYIKENSVSAAIEGYDENGEHYNKKVTPGETRIYTVTSEDGTTQDYKITFVESEGISTEVDMSIVVPVVIDGVTNYHDGYLPFSEDENDSDTMVSYVELPYNYDVNSGVTLRNDGSESVSFEGEFNVDEKGMVPGKIYPGKDDDWTFEFIVKSPNGEVTKNHVIYFALEDKDAADSTALECLDVYFEDEDGNSYYYECNLENVQDGNFEIHLPKAADNRCVNFHISAAGYGNLYNCPDSDYGYGDYGYCGLGYDMTSDEPISFTFNVMSTSGTQQKTYSVVADITGAAETHMCSWEVTEGTDATCTEDGVKTYTCTYDGCGEPKTVEISATNHAFGDVEYTWSADNSQVTAKRVCANDAKHVEEETVKSVYSVVTAAKCETKGAGKYTATFENSAFATQTKTVDIPATNHAYGDVEYTWSADNSQVTAKRICTNDVTHVEKETVNSVYSVVTAAGCETKGTGKYTATFENSAFATQTKTVEIPAINHNYDKVVTAPTCTEKGYTTYTCKNDASHTYVGDYVNANGHKMTHHAAVAATCETAGNIEYYTCNVCKGYFLDQTGATSTTAEKVVTAAKKHNYASVVTAPTCTEKGYTTYTCKNDASHTYVGDYVNANGHKMTYHAAVTATCETAGNIEYYTCNVCKGYFLDQTGATSTTAEKVVTAATKHNYAPVVTAPTCTEKGYTTYTCKNDASHTYIDDYVDALGHDMSVDKTVKATTTKDGYHQGKCSRCEETITETIYKVGAVTLSDAKYTYSGTAKKPTVTVTDSEGNVISADNYTVKYATGRKNVGRYKVTVTFKGDYDGTKPAYFVIVPKAPSKASATLYGYDDVKFSWSKSTGATGYTVYYKESTSEEYTYLTRTTALSIKKANLSAGVEYDFKVVPYYTYSKKRYASLEEKTASVYTLAKLGKPEVTKYSASAVKVAWTDIEGQSGYQISRSTTKSGTNIVSTYATTTGVSKSLTATKGRPYYYKVRAYKTVGKTKVYGPWSTAVKYKLELAAPTKATASLYGYNDIKVSWSKVSGASGYTVYYKKASSSKYTYLTRTTAVAIKKANLSAGVQYDFKVVPYYKAGSTRYASVNYAEASVITLKTMAAPVLSEGMEAGKLSAAWTNVAGSDGVQLAAAKTKSGKYTTLLRTKDPEQVSSEITPKKGYSYYKIRAYKKVGSSYIYGPWSAVVKY